MLDRLPIELIHEILDLAVPLTREYWNHNERLRTLSFVSRSSRRMWKAAQPLLGRLVLPSWQDIELWDEEGVPAAIWKHGRVLALMVGDNAGEDVFDRDDLWRALERFPHIPDLRIAGEEGICLAHDLDMLREMLALRRLQFAKVSLEVDDLLTFSHLVELSLHFCVINQEDFDFLVNVDSLPSLKALNLNELCHMPEYNSDNDPWGIGRATARPYFPILPDNLLPRLDMLQVDSVDLELFPGGLFSSTTPILLDVMLAGLDDNIDQLEKLYQRAPSVPKPKHLRFWSCEGDSDVLFTLQVFNDILKLAGDHLRTLYLPTLFDRSSRLPPPPPSALPYPIWDIPEETHEGNLSLRDQFFRLVDKKGIRVRYEDRDEERPSGVHISQDFLSPHAPAATSSSCLALSEMNNSLASSNSLIHRIKAVTMHTSNVEPLSHAVDASQSNGSASLSLYSLQQLVLNNLEVEHAFSPLPKLTQLTLISVNLPPTDLSSLLSPRITPNLRAVYLDEIRRPIEWDQFGSVSTDDRVSYHENRFDMLQFSGDGGEVEAPDRPFQSDTPLLVSYRAGGSVPLVHSQQSR
ncbi:hypothetical protein JCM11641_001100 [Rhodosporidiobolus odoratus]